MKKALAAVATGALSLAASLPASAAEINVSPVKRCYGSGEKVDLTGSGFTPNNRVVLAYPGFTFPDPLFSNSTGAISGLLTIGLKNGRERRTYTATDTTDPTLTASREILVSERDVVLRPRNGAPGTRLSIDADGFTDGRTLRVHVDPPGRGSVRNMKIGRLRGICRSLVAKRRLLPPDAKVGLWIVQFDTFRRYKRERERSVGYEFTVRRVFRPAAAAASWNRVF